MKISFGLIAPSYDLRPLNCKYQHLWHWIGSKLYVYYIHRTKVRRAQYQSNIHTTGRWRVRRRATYTFVRSFVWVRLISNFESLAHSTKLITNTGGNATENYRGVCKWSSLNQTILEAAASSNTASAASREKVLLFEVRLHLQPVVPTSSLRHRRGRWQLHLPSCYKVVSRAFWWLCKPRLQPHPTRTQFRGCHPQIHHSLSSVAVAVWPPTPNILLPEGRPAMAEAWSVVHSTSKGIFIPVWSCRATRRNFNQKNSLQTQQTTKKHHRGRTTHT